MVLIAKISYYGDPFTLKTAFFYTEASGLNSEGGFNFEWSLEWNFTVLSSTRKSECQIGQSSDLSL